MLDAHDAVSSILAPLRVGDRVVGLMSFTYTGISGRHYEDHDRDLAGEIARRVALAVENARLARLADRATERLNLLARTSDLLTLELDSGVRVEALAAGGAPDVRRRVRRLPPRRRRSGAAVRVRPRRLRVRHQRAALRDDPLIELKTRNAEC